MQITKQTKWKDVNTPTQMNTQDKLSQTNETKLSPKLKPIKESLESPTKLQWRQYKLSHSKPHKLQITKTLTKQTTQIAYHQRSY